MPETTELQTRRCVGIVAAMHKRGIAAAVHDVITWLEARGHTVILTEEQAAHLELAGQGRPAVDFAREADLVLSLGGDGTLLSTARLAAPEGTPLLGINLGGFGFLATLPAGAEMLDGLARVFAQPVIVQPRMMLRATLVRQQKEVISFLALNDIVVGKGAFSRLFRLRTRIDNELVSVFPADGMIVATPTGSTGYSLSAGGPVLDPTMRAIIITPICPHALTARPLIVPPTCTLEMTMPELLEEMVTLTADGQQEHPLAANDVVQVREAAYSARFVVPPDSSFYARLRGKLGWGSAR